MHPNKFFKEVNLRTEFNVVEIYDGLLKNKLVNSHPLNFIKTTVELPVYQITIGYTTKTNTYKKTTKYMVMNRDIDEENSDVWAEIYLRDYSKKHGLKELHVIDILHICDAVLPIG